MRRMAQLAGTMGMMILILTGASWEQPQCVGIGGSGRHYGMMWDAKTLVTLSGEVISVDRYTPGRGGGSYGLSLTVKTDKETLPVILGADWYVEKQNVKIEPKDKVGIKGSRVMLQDQPTILAAEVKKGDKILKLRDDKGVPLWAGPR